jgi:hypothetical protein
MLIGNKIPKIETNKILIEALKSATSRKLTAKELLEQRVSFIYGSLKSNSSITKEEVRKAIKKQEGIEEA